MRVRLAALLAFCIASFAAGALLTVSGAGVPEPPSRTPERCRGGAAERSARRPDQSGAAPNDEAAAESEASTVSVPVEGTNLVRGKSTVSVAAPIERVREAVLDFAHYPEFMPHYTNAKLLGRKPG